VIQTCPNHQFSSILWSLQCLPRSSLSHPSDLQPKASPRQIWWCCKSRLTRQTLNRRTYLAICRTHFQSTKLLLRCLPKSNLWNISRLLSQSFPKSGLKFPVGYSSYESRLVFSAPVRSSSGTQRHKTENRTSGKRHGLLCFPALISAKYPWEP